MPALLFTATALVSMRRGIAGTIGRASAPAHPDERVSALCVRRCSVEPVRGRGPPQPRSRIRSGAGGGFTDSRGGRRHVAA
jgi:hypothetical protein